MGFKTYLGICSLVLMGVTVMAPDAAQADRNIRRSCTALYGIEIHPAEGHHMESSADAAEPEPRWFAEFEGSGGCRKINPNKCRRSAQDAIFGCAETHWRTRTIGTTPRVCTGGSVSGYTITDLTAAARDAACTSRTGKVRATLHVTSLGSMGCGGGRTLGGGMTPIGPLPRVNRAAEDQATKELGTLTFDCGGNDSTAATAAPSLANAAALGTTLRGATRDADGTQTCKARLKMDGEGLAWDYEGGTWSEANAERLCRGTGNPQEPVQCFDWVMHTEIDWGGGTRWNPNNALDLCEGSDDARATIDCFREEIEAGQGWSVAIHQCGK